MRTALSTATVLVLVIGVAAAQSPAPPKPPELEFLGILEGEGGDRTVVENGPQGTRTITQPRGGRFDGPRLKATLVQPAGDWITNRADGTYRMDVRFTLKTDDGAFILVTYNGIGETTPAGSKLRGAPLFETGHPRYTWLNRIQAIAIGERSGNTIRYTIWALK